MASSDGEGTVPPPDHDDHHVLTAAGLSPAEGTAYELLIDCPAASLSQLAAVWTRPESLCDTLTALEAKGLVTRPAERPGQYAAADPNVALEALLLSREQRLSEASRYIARLVATYQESGTGKAATELVEVVTGYRAVRQRLTQVQRSAEQEVCCLDKPPYVDQWSSGVQALELLGRGVSCRTIYERASIDLPGSFTEVERLIEAGEQARIVATVPMKLYLTDRRLAFLPLHREPTSVDAAIVIHPSGLLDAISELFEGTWRRALPLHLSTGDTRRAAPRHRIPVNDDRLIALLLSGLTDQAIARQLGMGHRTIQRRVAALNDRLGAHTRFQAGVQAALRNIRGNGAGSDQPR